MDIGDFVKDHVGTICSGLALVGLGASVYFSGKETLDAQDIDEDLEGMDKMKAYAKVYSKTIISVSITAGLIVASDRAHTKKETLLAGAAALWSSQYMNLQESVDETVDKETKEKVKKKEAEKATEKKTEKAIDPHVIHVYDPITDQYFDTTSEALYWGLLKTNEEFARNGDVSYDYLLRKVGAKTGLKDADDVGWNIENTIQDYNWTFSANAPYISYIFDTELDDKGKPIAMIMGFNVEPIKQLDEDMGWFNQ